MFKVILAALFGIGMATAATAESATMKRSIQAASLHEGPLDMVAYWVPLEDDGYEVTATFIGRIAGDQPTRIVMKMVEGDNVAFSMPGYRSSLYRFTRHDGVVNVSVEATKNNLASR